MTAERDPGDLFREAEETLSGPARGVGADPQRDLLMLLELSKAMNAHSELRPLLDHALDLLVEATAAERGTLLAAEMTASGEDTVSFATPLSVVAASLRGAEEDAAVSQGIAREVLRTGRPFHSDSLASDPRVELMESVAAQGLAWAVAVPLRCEGRVIGVFYADSRQPGARLMPDALPFVEALAEQAAIAIQRARLLEAAREREAARREVEELRRLNEQKSRFVRQLAHEVGNPLTAIAGYARRLQGEGDERQQKAARIVLEEAERLTRLVEDLLDLARARGAPARRHGAFGLRACVERTRESLSLSAEAVELPAEDVGLAGDEDDLRRVMSNLVDNAFKHGASRVRVSAATPLGRAEIEVEDDGPGIPAAERALVFDEFWRGPRTEPSRSHGLGLSIVKALVEGQGGAIRVEASPLGGAAFRFDWAAAE